MAKYVFSQEFIASVCEFYLTHTVGETSLQFNISKKVVERIIRNNKIPRHKVGIRRLITDSDKQFIINNYKNMSDSALAKSLNIHIPHLLEIFNDLGLLARSHEENVLLGQKSSQQTCLKKYGTANVFQNEDVKIKIQKSINEKYGENKKLITEKRKTTCLKKYGHEYSLQAKEVREKSKDTCLEKYGVDCNMKTSNFRKKLKEYMTIHKEEVVNKRQQTCLEKYGCKSPTQLEDIKEKIRVNSYAARKKNNTLNTSKIEDDFYEDLVKLFDKPDIFRQYKEDRYPFSCDFYIKSLDLFIELNFHWSHGFRPFDKNNKECIDRLSLWEKRAEKSVYYKAAINTWLNRDTKKQIIAKENNLNYISIYSYKELEIYLTKLKQLKGEFICG